jgi:hypothetical protein
MTDFPNRLIIISVCVLSGGCKDATINAPGAVFDAGAILVSSPQSYTHTFTVANASSIPIRFISETHSCACTTVTFTPRTLLPNDTMPLSLTVSLFPAYAKNQLSCVLLTDHPTDKEWPYSLQVETFPPIIVSPQRLDFGSLDVLQSSASPPIQPSSHDVLVSVYSAGDRPVASRRLRVASPKCLLVTLDTTPVEESLNATLVRSTYKARISLNLNLVQQQSGPRTERGVFSLSDGSQNELLVSWNVQGRLDCEPSRLHFGMVGGDDPPKPRKLVVRSHDGTLFRIEAVETASAAVIVAPGHGIDRTALSAVHEFAVVFLRPVAQPKQQVIAQSGVITIKTTASGGSTAEVAWSAFLR